jgi:hypothetical protein
MANLCTCSPLFRSNFVYNYYDGVQVHHFPSLFLHIFILWTYLDYVYLCSGLFGFKVVSDDHYEKRGVLQLTVQLNFLVAKDTCNSLYIWCNSLQRNQNYSFSTTMQFHYNYTHNVMLMSLIVIHLLKSNTWHYEDFWTSMFFEILISIIHYDY